jgi:hypothetical protein
VASEDKHGPSRRREKELVARLWAVTRALDDVHNLRVCAVGPVAREPGLLAELEAVKAELRGDAVRRYLGKARPRHKRDQ